MPHRTIRLHTEPGLWPLTWPMGLTMLRLLLLPVFLWMLLVDAGPPTEIRGHRWVALAIFAIMAATDKLDGYLARRLNQTSKLGTLLDPLADKLLIASSMVLLSFQWIAPQGFTIPLWVVIAVYAKDLIVAVGSIVLLSLAGQIHIRPRMLGKASTVLQLAVVMATLLAPDIGKMGPAVVRWLLVSLWWSVTIIAVASCVDYVLEGVRQFKDRKQHAVQPNPGNP